MSDPTNPASEQTPNYKPGDIVNGHVLGTDYQWHLSAPTPEVKPAPDYKPGDIVNGHVLGTDNQWHLMAVAPTPAPTPAEAVPAVAVSTLTAPASSVKQAAKPSRRRRVLIIVGSTVAALVVLIIFIGAVNGAVNPKSKDASDYSSRFSQSENDTSEESPEAEPVEEEPEQIVVADVTDLSVPNAIAALNALGFEVAPGADEDGIVTGTDPAVGTTLEEGSTITLTYTVPVQLTLAQENAIATAESYLSHMSFSRSGLIDQLEYEGFTTAEAKFAVDYTETDWTEQAGLVAANYMDSSSFSSSSLYDQLIYEGFSDAQAKAGLKAVGY